ncbi:MAG: hypothetical protein J5I53_01990 [Bradyrhizobiaceae bacterium]|nr:hypothetical protein [Bradyrhizobiaceae bacterium]
MSPQCYLPAEQHHVQPAWYPPEIDKAQWDLWFADGNAPSVLDIGCGRGGFMLQYAIRRPEHNVLGLEVRETLVNWINRVVSGEHIPNARALWYSVANGLSWIPDSCIETAVYLFADPWPKKRHQKRRAFSSPLLDELDRVMKVDGILYLASDRADVQEHQRDVIAEHGVFRFEEVSRDLWPFDFPTDQQSFCDRKGIPYGLYRAFR